MAMQADKKYVRSVYVVLNKIKDGLLFDPEHKRTVDYMFNGNAQRQAGEIGQSEERDILQQLRNEEVISDTDEADICTIGEQGTKDYQAFEKFHFKISNSFEDYYEKYQKSQILMDNYFWFDNNTFFLTLRDGSVKTISFDTERGGSQQLAIFRAITDHWKFGGNAPITGKQVVDLMAKYGSVVDVSQLKNIFSNLRNKKIKPSGLESLISITYQKKPAGWMVKIIR